MWPFKKKVDENRPVPIETVELETPVEIVAAKNANKEQIEEVKKANETIKKVFERNHFTVKLYVAAGHNPPKANT